MIILTGGTGFLGSNLLGRLLAENCQVGVVTRSNSNLYRVDKWKKNPNIKFFNIEKMNARSIFEENNVEIIIHTATEYGRLEPSISKILDANLILPIRLVELGIEFGVKCFINTDSYFNKSNNSYSNLLNYSLSKKSLLVWLKKLSDQISVINVSLEHMYGPGDNHSKFVENIIRNVAVEMSPVVPMTHGHQKRDFVYVDDVVSAFMKLIEYSRTQKFTFKTFEVGTGESIQVRDFVNMIKLLSRSPSIFAFGDIPYRHDEIMESKADLSSMLEIGWSPKIEIQEGLLKILKDYEK